MSMLFVMDGTGADTPLQKVKPGIEPTAMNWISFHRVLCCLILEVYTAEKLTGQITRKSVYHGLKAQLINYRR